MSNLFYLQDSRSYVGNDVVFWAINGNGYTTDLRKAQTYTFEQAQAMHNARETDIPWPKDYIDGKTRPAVDVQYIGRSVITRSGIKLIKKQKAGTYVPRCIGCGRFLRDADRHSIDCPNCGTDNRP